MIEWEETIDHPGRYIISFSSANDQGFELNVLRGNIPDIQNRATLPHKYVVNVTVPNHPCEACTLQLVQSMEENPAAPS